MAESSRRAGKAGAATKGGAAQPTAHEWSAARVLRAVVLVGVYGGLLMPLVVLNDYVVFPYIFAKLLTFQALIGLTLPACLALWVLDPKRRPRASFLLGALALYFVALGVSTLRSIDPHRSFWSNQERMSGYFQLLHYFAWFLMATTALRTWKEWKALLWYQAGVGGLMATVAILQQPGLFPKLIGEGSDVRVSGTLGNAIFSGAWHMIQIFLLAFLWARTKDGVLRAWLVIGAAWSLYALWLSGSRGPLVAIFVGANVAAFAWALRNRNRGVFLGTVVFDALLAASYVFIARVLVPLPALESFWRSHFAIAHIFDTGDPIRRHLWPQAWKAFVDRPVTGFGLSTFDLAFDVHHDPWFRCYGLPNTLQDSSHSLIFDHLSTTGLLGFSCFLLLWIAVFAALLKALRGGLLPQASAVVLVAAPAAYLFQGLFVFDSPGIFLMTYLLMALALQAGAGLLAEAPPPEPAPKPSAAAARAWPWALLAFQVLGCALVFQYSVQPFRASWGNKKAQEAWRAGSCAKMVEASRAAFAIPSPWLDDQLFAVARDLGSLSSQGKLVQACPQWRDLLEHGRTVASAILANHPVHARQRSILATLLHLVGRETQDQALFADAGPLLERLVGESPLRQQYRYDFSNWLIDAGKVQEARAQLEIALKAEETVGDSLWRLGSFYWRNLQQPKQGAELMARAMEGSCPYPYRSPIELQQLAQAYTVTGNRNGLKSMVRRIEDLGRDDKSTAIYLGVAGYLERNGLIAERDQVLDLARQRDFSVIAKLAPLKDGRVKSLTDLERLSGTSTPEAPK